MKILICSISLLLLLSCQKDEIQKGTAKSPFVMALTPSENATNSVTQTRAIQNYLEKSMSQKLYGKEEGFYVNVVVPNSYIAVLEGLGSKRVEFAPISTLNYVMARQKKKLPIDVILVGAGDRNDDAHYFSQLIVRSDSQIKSIEDLDGKKMAYTDPASTSGHLVPKAMLNKLKIKPSETLYAQRHDSVVTMVYQKKVDVGATYHIPPKNGVPRDARSRVTTQFPDVYEKIKILKLSDPIPNSPWVLRNNIYSDVDWQKKVEKAFSDSLIEYIQTEEGRVIFETLNNITKFVPETNENYEKKMEVFDLSLFEELL